MAIEKLLEIMDRLRDPKRGCPWDLKQDFGSIAPHTLVATTATAESLILPT